MLTTGCSGGGGSSDSLPPTLVGASFQGAGGTPTAGDLLVLAFSEDVQATVGAAVGDVDFSLSGAGTLGSATTVLDQPTSRSLRLQLGAGVSFVPDTTTAQFAATNTVVRDLAGNVGRDGTAVVIGTTDGAAPTLSRLTLDAIDAVLNGTGPAGGTLQVPTTGFVVDLTYLDTASIGSALNVDPTQTQITANVPVSTSGGSQPAGTNLMPFLTAVTANTTTGSYAVPTSTTFPQGAVTLTAVVVDNGGLASSPAQFVFTVRAFSTTTQPFDTGVNAQQVWFLDTSRDVESFTTSTFGTGAAVNVVTTANARSDYLDILYVLGLQSATTVTVGSVDSNTFTLDRLQNEILTNLGSLFSSTKVTFTFTQPSGSFGSNSNVPYDSLGYSQICLGGSDNDGSLGILGIAQLDPNNQRQNNDCLLESASTSRLGVFLHTIADTGLRSGAASAFRQSFNFLSPALATGSAIGTVANDANRLQGTVGDSRETAIDNAIAGLARYVAVIVAHECGHSMGLVVNGAMPTGLYGGDAVNFPGSSDGHISNSALFSSGINVMSPELSFVLGTDSNTGFNSLNLAYLREQAFYGN